MLCNQRRKNLRNISGTKSKNNLSQNKKMGANLDGRRLFHLKTFSDQMYCQRCKYPLNLNDTTEEEHHGMALVFFVKCTACDFVKTVESDKEDKFAITNKPVFDINTKVALGR